MDAIRDPSTPNPAAPANRARRRRPRWAWWLLPLVAGAVPRLRGLGDQVLAEDEIHGLFAAGSRSVGDLLSTLTKSSFSPPLTALARALADAGVPLGEWTLRLPTVLAGLALLVLAPWPVARRWGRTAGALFATLLALSPLLVVHSRHARPYLPALLLTLASLHCLHRGWFERRRGRLAGAAVLAALAIWALPVVAPAVAAPWAVILVGLARDRPVGARARWREAARAALLGAALVTAAFAPTIGTFGQGIGAKLGLSALPRWQNLALTLAGSPVGAVAASLAATALAGWWLIARRRPGLALVAGLAAGAQLAACVLVRPFGFGAVPVAARYLMIAIPLALLGSAVFFATLLRRLTRAPSGRAAAMGVVAIGAGLLLAGPLPEWLGPARRLLSYSAVQDFVQRPLGELAGALPPAYRFVRSLEPARVAVAPATMASGSDRIFLVPALRLDRDLLLAIEAPYWMRRARPRLASLRDQRPRSLLASAAEAVILHRRPLEATAGPGGGPARRSPEPASQRPRAERLEREYRRAWGKPHYLDGDHAVWNLRRLRRERADKRRD